MWRFLTLALLAVGCACAPPAEPRVVEHVVYASAPYPAPVIIEHRGHGDEHGAAPKRPTSRWPSHAPKRHHGSVATREKPEKGNDHAKHDKVAKPDKHDKVAKPGKGKSYAKCEKREKHAKCGRSARHTNRTDVARR